MVRGVEKFKEYFRDYAGQYTFIGGTACDIILCLTEAKSKHIQVYQPSPKSS